MEIIWSKRLSVCNAILDDEHQKIIKLVNDVEFAIKAKKVPGFAAALKLLEMVTRNHFSHEAKIAQAIHYNFDHHHFEHQYILKEMQIIEAELSNQLGKWSESVAEHYFQFLSTWAIDHIDQDDMKLKVLLEQLPYDYKPDGL